MQVDKVPVRPNPAPMIFKAMHTPLTGSMQTSRIPGGPEMLRPDDLLRDRKHVLPMNLTPSGCRATWGTR